MMCEKCGQKEATVFVTANSTNKEYYICSDCAKERQLSESLGLLSSINDTKICTCKTSLQEIKESGFVGCSKCYETFKEELLPIISSLHGHLVHKGKKMLSKAENLKIQIEKAKQNKFFSLAEKLEKELLQLREGGMLWVVMITLWFHQECDLQETFLF